MSHSIHDFYLDGKKVAVRGTLHNRRCGPGSSIGRGHLCGMILILRKQAHSRVFCPATPEPTRESLFAWRKGKWRSTIGCKQIRASRSWLPLSVNLWVNFIAHAITKVKSEAGGLSTIPERQDEKCQRLNVRVLLIKPNIFNNKRQVVTSGKKYLIEMVMTIRAP